jgi:imidazolonepropionase
VTRQDKPAADTVIVHLGQLATCAGPAPRRGRAQGAVDIVEDGALAIGEGRIAFAGASADLDTHVTVTQATAVHEAPNLSAAPGFVDPHTHAVFAGDRRGELRRRLAGATYTDIAAAGGGIVATVRATRAASEQDLIVQSRPRLDEMLACGTTTCEVKSGYGLDLASELRMLTAIQQLSDSSPLDIVATFMGAHEIPIEYRDRRDEYVSLVVDRMIPEVAARGLAQWCDVFCETGVFTPAESARILAAGMRAGLKPRIHADELGASGGSQVAAQVGARSADHLVHVDAAGIAALAGAGVTATLLPCAAFYLKLGRFAPARALIDAGVPVALATDVNPGGGFSPSMPFAMSLAAFAMNMTFEEALAGATINAAWSLDRAGEVGSLEPGKLADVVFVRGDLVNLIRVGADAVAAVMKRGTLVRGTLQAASPQSQLSTGE